MANKFQVPVVGGVRKVIKLTNTATTIAGLEGQTISLSQIAALIASNIGLSPTTSQPAVATQTVTSTTGANITIDSHPYPELPANDEFEYGSTIDTTGARFTSAAAWSALGNYQSQHNLYSTVSNGALTITVYGVATSGSSPAGWYQPITTSAWTYTAKLSLNPPNSNSGTPPIGGLFVATSASGSALTFGLSVSETGALTAYQQTYLITSSGAISIISEAVGNPTWNYGTGLDALRSPTEFVYVQVYAGFNAASTSTVFFAISPTGYPGTFITVGNFIGYWTSAVGLDGIKAQNCTLVGLFCNAYTSNTVSASSMIMNVDWFRKTS